MGREDFSQSSQLTTLVGKPNNRYKQLPKNVGTLKSLTQARAKPNNRLHYSAYPLIQKAYSATYTQLTTLDFYSPIINILGFNPVSHEVNTPYVDAGVTLDEGSELYNTVSTVDTSEFGSYSVVYTARDGINPDTTVTRIVKVGIPPDAFINGQNPINLERYDEYIEQGITINDSNSWLVSTTSTLNNATVGVYSVNYTVSNDAYTQVFSREVRVDDTVPPVITITGGTPYKLERFDPYVDEGATVDVGSVLTNTDLSQVQNTAIGSFNVVYTAYDGNTTVSNTRTVNVVDTVPPVITITNDTPTGNTLERYAIYEDQGATVDEGSILTTNLDQVDNTLIHNSTFDVTYSATDGNTLHDVTVTRTVTVKDTIPTALSLIGDNPYLIEPYIDFQTVDPGYSNDATTNVIANYDNVMTTDNSDFYVVYEGSDGVHSNVYLLRRVVVSDTISPVVTILGDNPYTHERFGVYTDPGVTVDAGSTLIRTDNLVTGNVGIVGSYYIEYEASDSINENTTVRRIVNVVDTTPPIVLLNGADPLTMERFAVFSDIDPGVTYQAPHTGTLTSVDISQLDNTAIGGGTVTYNVVDDQNLSNTISRAVTVVDTTPPVATLNNASTNYTLERYGDWSAIDPGVTVDAGSFVTQINIDNTTVGLNRPVDYVISDGNTLHDITVTRNITIEDTVLPYAELVGSNNMRVPLYSVWEDVDLGIQNLDAGSSLDYVSGFNNTVTNAQFVYYNLTDGVNSSNILRVVTCTLPSGTVNTAVSTTLEKFDTYVEPHEAIIVADGYLARIDTSNVDSTAAHGTQQVIVYDLGDDVNNTLFTRTITIQDTTAPTGTVNTAASSTLERFGTYVEPDEAIIVAGGYVARIDTSNVDSTVAHGTQQVIVYDLGDDVNNTLVTRTITIQDTTAPTGTVNTAASSTLERFDTYVEPDEAIINMDQSTYVARIDTSNVDSTAAHGTQQVIVYDLGDDVNSNLLLTRTITIQDTVPPVITITNDTLTGNTLERLDVYSDEGATVDQGSQLTNTDLSNVQNTATGTFDVVYTAYDGNTTSTAIRTVSVVDTTPPVITLTHGNYNRRLYNTTYTPPGVTTDEPTTVTNNAASNVAPYMNNYDTSRRMYTYTATDTAGNISTADKTVSIERWTWKNYAVYRPNPNWIGQHFGWSVAISGDGLHAIIGEEGVNQTGGAGGDIWYFSNNAAGSTQFTSGWTQQQQITDVANYASVDMDSSGNTVIIGNPETPSTTPYGKAYIYTRSGTTWSLHQTLTATDSSGTEIANHDFGRCVTMSGDGNYAIVGAKKVTNGTVTTEHSAYIFKKTGTTWSLQQVLTQPLTTKLGEFAFSMSIDRTGQRAVIGGPYAATGWSNPTYNPTHIGNVWVFKRTNTTWSTESALTVVPPNGQLFWWGFAVSISGDGDLVVVSGRESHTSYGSINYNGSSFVIYKRTNTTWSISQIIGGGWDGQGHGQHPLAISDDGNTIVAGKPLYSPGGSQSGGVQVFIRGDETENFRSHGILQVGSPGTYDTRFGSAVSVNNDGTLFAVGAWGHQTIGGNAYQRGGSVHFFSAFGA